ncbi:MAG: type II secretion system GspH family protein [Deltaproteobacteria bacterium]|nr:type II secretion system GspH family protein [Deltaproteobacteria bacterium]
MKRIALARNLIIFDNKGFTLLEIILVVLILAIAIVPMVRAFSPGAISAKTEEETTVFTNQARGTLNRVMALDFDTLNSNQGAAVDLATLFGGAAEAAKESFTFKGENHTPTVAITDVSGGAGGLLELTVTISHIQLATRKAQY